MKRIGTRDEVWDKEAHHTRGGLEKKDLFLHKDGKIKSIRASEHGKRMFEANGLAEFKAPNFEKN